MGSLGERPRDDQMKLLTHNMLTSPGQENGFPLALEAQTVEEIETEFNPDFIVRMVERLEWNVLVTTATSIGKGEGMPEQVPEDFATNEEFLKGLHHVLLEVQVIEGTLTCPV